MGLWINWIFGVILILTSHPLHLSVTNIEYNDSINKWVVSVKLFKDDFADELYRLYQVDLDIDKESTGQEQEAYFRSFIADHFMLQINKDTIGVDTWEFTGRQVNPEAILLNYSFYYSDLPRDIYIENSLMFGLFPDQKNLLIFTFKDEQKAFQFRQNKPQIHFVIE